MRKSILAVLFVVVVCFMGSSASAGDFYQEMAAATANIPAGADSAGMGGATTSTPEFSTTNPAVIAVGGKEGKSGASVTYGRIGFAKGPAVNIYSGTASVKLPVGVVQVTFSDANSGTKATAMDLDAKFNSAPSLSILYGAKVAQDFLKKGDELYLGVSYSPLQKSKLTFSSEGTNLLRAKSSGFSYGAGLLYKPTKELNFGASYSRSRSKDEGYDYLLDETAKSVSKTEQVRIGTSVQVLPMTFVAVDFQHLKVSGVTKNQVFAGIEHGIIKDLLYVYGGFAGRIKSPTVGLGIYGKSYGLNLAYMHNPFDGLRPYLGRSNVAMATFYISF